MKLLVFSDSHGYTHNMIKALAENSDADMVIHLGDLVKDAVRLGELYGNIRIENVYGNNDWVRDCASEKLLSLEGRKIFITHGHNYGVKYDYLKIITKGKAIGADAVLFGHTHEPEELYTDGMLLLNPGSISFPLYPGKPTYCCMELSGDRVSVRFNGV